MFLTCWNKQLCYEKTVILCSMKFIGIFTNLAKEQKFISYKLENTHKTIESLTSATTYYSKSLTSYIKTL